jgi:hypothetical protein
MEYLIVRFPTARRVKINGVASAQWLTGSLIEVEGGHHTVTLAGLPDYRPRIATVDLAGTDPLNPYEVRFVPRR